MHTKRHEKITCKQKALISIRDDSWDLVVYLQTVL
jgi:hypothetical protein